MNGAETSKDKGFALTEIDLARSPLTFLPNIVRRDVPRIVSKAANVDPHLHVKPSG